MSTFAVARPIGRTAWVRPMFTVAGALVLGLAAGIVVLAIVATRLFGYQVLTVSSDSMAPALSTGDLILVKPAAIGDVKPGDVVLFESGGDRIPTIHRVSGVNEIETRITDRTTGAIQSLTEYRLVTKGDHNVAPDSREVTADRLRGELWFSIPHAGALGNAGISSVLAVVLGVAVASWIGWEFALRLRNRGHRHADGSTI